MRIKAGKIEKNFTERGRWIAQVKSASLVFCHPSSVFCYLRSLLALLNMEAPILWRFSLKSINRELSQRILILGGCLGRISKSATGRRTQKAPGLCSQLHPGGVEYTRRSLFPQESSPQHWGLGSDGCWSSKRAGGVPAGTAYPPAPAGRKVQFPKTKRLHINGRLLAATCPSIKLRTWYNLFFCIIAHYCLWDVSFNC